MNIVKYLHQKDEKGRNVFIMSNVITKSKPRVGYFIWNLIGWPLILVVIQGIISGLVALIPVVGWIIAIVSAISLFFEVLGCVWGAIKLGTSHIRVTDTGVSGRRSDKLRKFNLAYAEIDQINDKDGITIFVKKVNKNGKIKKKMIKIENVANEEEILQAVRFYSKEAKKNGGNVIEGAEADAGVTVVNEMDEILEQSLKEEAAKAAAKAEKAAAKAEKAAAKAAKAAAEEAEMEQMLDNLAKEAEEEKK